MKTVTRWKALIVTSLKSLLDKCLTPIDPPSLAQAKKDGYEKQWEEGYTAYCVKGIHPCPYQHDTPEADVYIDGMLEAEEDIVWKAK